MSSRASAGPTDPTQDRRLIAVTSNGIVLVFSKDAEGLLGDVPALDAGTSDAKERTSGFGLRALIRVELPRDSAGILPQIKSLVTYGKGFALAGTAGFFVVYEKTDDKKEPYMHIKTLKQGSWPPSLSIAASLPTHALVYTHTTATPFE
jgi:hypothetical protein